MTLSPPNASRKATLIHSLILLGSLLFTMLGSGEGYRTCAYLNLIMVLLAVTGVLREYQPVPWRRWALAACFPLAFIVLHLLAAGSLAGEKYPLKILLIASNFYALLMLGDVSPGITRERLLKSLLITVSVFVIIQFLAYDFRDLHLVHSWHYGTLSNPHHLALFIILTVPILLYGITVTAGYARGWIVFLLLAESYLLLQTSSRPAWLALLGCGLAIIPFFSARRRYVYLALLIFCPLVLYQFGPALFHERMLDLAVHISTEERVAIWSNSWHLQQTSALSEWIFGHGLSSYEPAMKAFQHARGIADRVFPHPHNFVLEILFTSGVAGLLVAGILYGQLFGTLVGLGRDRMNSSRPLALVVLATAIAHFIHTFLTLPFFSHYNLYILSLLFGARHFLLRGNAVPVHKAD